MNIYDILAKRWKVSRRDAKRICYEVPLGLFEGSTEDKERYLSDIPRFLVRNQGD